MQRVLEFLGISLDEARDVGWQLTTCEVTIVVMDKTGTHLLTGESRDTALHRTARRVIPVCFSAGRQPMASSREAPN